MQLAVGQHVLIELHGWAASVLARCGDEVLGEVRHELTPVPIGSSILCRSRTSNCVLVGRDQRIRRRHDWPGTVERPLPHRRERRRVFIPTHCAHPVVGLVYHVAMATNSSFSLSTGDARVGRRNLKGDRREQAILEGAYDLLRTTPLRNISIVDITTRAELSRSSFYFYFESKWQVLSALLSRVTADVFRASQL